MTSIQPELWVDRAGAAIAFYEQAFGARVIHRVGDEDDIVAQPSVGDALFWVTASNQEMKASAPTRSTTTSRTLLVVDDPEQVVTQAVAAGAIESSPVADEHGWRLGRIIDPFRSRMGSSQTSRFMATSLKSRCWRSCLPLAARGDYLSSRPRVRGRREAC